MITYKKHAWQVRASDTEAIPSHPQVYEFNELVDALVEMSNDEFDFVYQQVKTARAEWKQRERIQAAIDNTPIGCETTTIIIGGRLELVQDIIVRKLDANNVSVSVAPKA